MVIIKTRKFNENSTQLNILSLSYDYIERINCENCKTLKNTKVSVTYGQFKKEYFHQIFIHSFSCHFFFSSIYFIFNLKNLGFTPYKHF